MKHLVFEESIFDEADHIFEVRDRANPPKRLTGPANIPPVSHLQQAHEKKIDYGSQERSRKIQACAKHGHQWPHHPHGISSHDSCIVCGIMFKDAY